MASETQLFTNYKNCAEQGGTDCEELSFQTSPEFEAITKRIQNSAVTRNRGTSRSSSDEPIGYQYVNQSALTGQDPEANTNTVSLGLNTKFNFGASTTESPPNAGGESTVEVDDGGINREESLNEGTTQSQLTNADRESTPTIEGGNKAYPYITPLASTNIQGLKLAPPHGDIDNGENGNLYDVRLLEDEGIIYLRQYLSFDDEETGAVWRFQYAPQIAWSASATFQEDKSWGTNVQPSHFSNKSGKKVTIQGAILEGMTIGKTVTGAVLALESLMSVANPDNELQVAPYAYRLIIGERTVTEPISGRHAPFVIEQMTVKEEMYDTQGEMISVKVDLTLKEIPYYQINDGRKLLIVTEDRADNVQLNCERISEELQQEEDAVKQRKQENTTLINEFVTNILNGEETQTALADTDNAGLTKQQVADNIAAEKTQEKDAGYLPEVAKNCNEDSDAYYRIAKLYREYNERNCRTTRPTEALKIIERQFAVDSGIYEILTGRRLTNQSTFFNRRVFDESGRRLSNYRDRLQRIGVLGVNAEFPFINSVNKYQTENTDGSGADTLRQERLIECNHIHCNSAKTAGTTNPDNIQKALKVLNWLTIDIENYRKILIDDSPMRGILTRRSNLVSNQLFGDISTDASSNRPALRAERRTLITTTWGYDNPDAYHAIAPLVGAAQTVTNIRTFIAGLFGQNLTFDQAAKTVFGTPYILPFLMPGGDYNTLFRLGGTFSQASANDGKYLGLVESDGDFKKAEVEVREKYGIRKKDFEFMKNTAEYEAVDVVYNNGFIGNLDARTPDVRAVSTPFNVAITAAYIYVVLSNKTKILRRPSKEHGSCNVEAIAAQDLETYENVVRELATYLENYLEQLPITMRSIPELQNQINAAAARRAVDGRVCPDFQGAEEGRTWCFGAYAIARVISDIILFFEDKGFTIQNPFGDRLVDVHGATGA